MATEVLKQTAVPKPIFYPDADGALMADSDAQYEVMTDTKFALQNFFHADPAVYVAANLLIYYEKGNPTKRVAPDVFVARGAWHKRRRSYKVWQERHLPNVVFEIASLGTWRKDVQKLSLYEALQIPEFFMLDPGGDYFNDVLMGYRLVAGAYQPMPYLPDGDKERGVFSEQLGLELWAQPRPTAALIYDFRFRHPHTGEWLLGALETDLARRAEMEARQSAEARAQTAEAQLVALQAELARLKSTKE